MKPSSLTLRMLFLVAMILIVSLPHMAAMAEDSISGAEAGDAGPFSPVSFEDGIRFGAPDEAYSLGIRFRIQNRADFYVDDTGDFTQDWQVRRARLRLNGHVVAPSLRYLVQFSFSYRDQDPTQGTLPQILRDAMILYEVTPSWQIGFGQGKLPGNRQRVVSSGDQQFVDRSIVNARFNLDRDFGFQTKYRFGVAQQIFSLDAAITSGEGRSQAIASTGSFFYIGRMEWLPFGAFSRNGDYFEGDLAFEPEARLSLGYSYAFLMNSARANGTVGEIFILPNGDIVRRDQHLQFADVMFKRRGLSAYVEYARRDVNNPIVSADLAHFRGYGVNAQVGHMLGEKNEVALRFSQLQPQGQSRQVYTGTRQWILGYNRFLRGHRVKLQAELGLTEKTEGFGRLQVELGI